MTNTLPCLSATTSASGPGIFSALGLTSSCNLATTCGFPLEDVDVDDMGGATVNLNASTVGTCSFDPYDAAFGSGSDGGSSEGVVTPESERTRRTLSNSSPARVPAGTGWNGSAEETSSAGRSLSTTGARMNTPGKGVSGEVRRIGMSSGVSNEST